MSAFYAQQTIPYINLLNTTTTITSAYNQYSGLTFSTGTITSLYGQYIAAPTGAGTITNKYAQIIESGAGNIGLGSTTPTSAYLSIQAPAGGGDILRVASSTGTVLMNVTASGNVGIGTTGPGAKLHVVGAGYLTTNLYLGTGSSERIYAGSPTLNYSYIEPYNAATGDMTFYSTFSTAGFNFNTANNATAKVRIDSAGNVGVGPVAPASLLHVSGGGTGARGAVRISDNGAGANYWEIGRDNTTTGDFTFSANTTEYMRIKASNGNVGIGTTSPGQKFSVAGGLALFNNNAAGGAQSGIRISSAVGTTKFNWMIGAQQTVDNGFEITPSTAAGGTTFSTPVLTVLSGGNIGIGTTGPYGKLDVRGAYTLSGAFIDVPVMRVFPPIRLR